MKTFPSNSVRVGPEKRKKQALTAIGDKIGRNTSL